MSEKRIDTVPGKWRQFLAALVANISLLSYGTMIGWQSPMTPQLQSPDTPVGEPMTDEEASWISGVMCLSGCFMTLVIGPITDRYGRKIVCCMAAVPFLICWLLTIFATEHLHIYIARFFAGIGGAVVLFVIPLYVSDISCDEIRGMLGSLLVFLLNMGILLAYILGAVLSFRVFAISALILPLLYLGLFVFMPESPVYLIRSNRVHQAARSLAWLRAGNTSAVEQEMLRLRAEREASLSEKSVGLSQLFRDKATIKGLIISVGLFCGQQMCGIFAMISYTQSIFELAGSSLSPDVAAMTVGAIQVFGSYLSTALMDRMGRKPLLLISNLGMCVCHLSLGTFCYLQILGYDVTSFAWIPIVSLSVFVITYAFGMGPGPYVVTAEIFSRDVASLGTTIGLFFVWLTAFVVVKFYSNLLALLGMAGCFFLFGIFCAGNAIFTVVLIPETKGRPRQLILDELNGIASVFDEKWHVVEKFASGKSAASAEHV